MFKTLPILLVVIYTARSDSATYYFDKRPTANDPAIPCTRNDGQVGECVPYYLCDDNSDSPFNNAGGIDLIASGNRCTSPYDICCLRSHKRPVDQPILPVIPKRKGCGWSNPNGVDLRHPSGNNAETKFGEFPWMVAILTRDTTSSSQGGLKSSFLLGGGSLIHPSIVLTAAHVVKDGDPMIVRAGDWDTQTDKEIFPYQERDVASVRIHEDFVAGNLFYDIAVVFLAEPMQLAPNVGIVCLPPPNIRQFEGNRCIATGWGKDKFGKEGLYSVLLKKVDLPVVHRDKCEVALRKTRLGQLFELHTSFMCAGSEPGKDSCTGDGGSPLSCPIAYEKDRYEQSGIVSWGIGCGGSGVPGVFVDVSKLREWIDDKVAGKGYDPRVYTW